jgi:hypothetical protein
VLPAVQLNDQPSGLAAEIDDITIDRHLPAKFQSAQTTIPQLKPQRALGAGLIVPQLSRNRDA